MPSFTPCHNLDNQTKAVPYKIHTILTDNGIQFAKREGTDAYWAIPFDRLYAVRSTFDESLLNRPLL